MRLLRIAGVALIWIAALAAIRSWCLEPYRCNVSERIAQANTPAAERASIDRYSITRLARQNLQRLQPCCIAVPGRVNILMVTAANLRYAGEPLKAIDLYERALQLDRRPELYANLGAARIEAAQYDRGLQDLITAAIYNPELADTVAAYAPQVKTAVDRYQLKLAAARGGAAR